MVLSCSLLFGGAIELTRPYVGLKAAFADFSADAVGVLISVSVGLTLHKVPIGALVRQHCRAGIGKTQNHLVC